MHACMPFSGADFDICCYYTFVVCKKIYTLQDLNSNQYYETISATILMYCYLPPTLPNSGPLHARTRVPLWGVLVAYIITITATSSVPNHTPFPENEA